MCQKHYRMRLDFVNVFIWKQYELAGVEIMPVIVRQMSDDEATILMVDSNIQRECILPR